MNYKPLSKREESIAGKIVDVAYTVHKNYIIIFGVFVSWWLKVYDEN